MDSRRINRISLAILAVGIVAAVAIWFLAPPAQSDGWRDDPLNQKRNRRQMEQLGGKANLLSAEFIDWFGGLWEGRNLAGTVLVLAVITTGGFRFVAVRMEPPPE
ncbi:MAG TPA: hypothetical protein VG734_27290 [Lacunisphaera sp.]|nr:hypothetical protein [Lacunisphaera sp.]